MDSPQRSLVPTLDGSLTLFHPETGELYHNSAGAYTEAYENYFVPSQAEYLLRQTNQLKVLDACYGLGYNTFVLLEELFAIPDLTGHIDVLAIELDEQILGFASDVLSNQRFARIQRAFSREEQTGGPCSFGVYSLERFALEGALPLTATINLVQADLRLALRRLAKEPDSVSTFDLIFHDAFSPRKVPELWTVNLFRNSCKILKPVVGKLLTYSTAKAVLAGLSEADFFLYRTTAVGRKRGGTLATTSPLENYLPGVFPLGEDEKAKLSSGLCVPYRDGESFDPREVIHARRLSEQGQNDRRNAT